MNYRRFKFSRQNAENSKHLVATALQYDPEHNGAPKVIARGQRKVAEQIIAEAKKHNISIYEDPVLTTALSNVNLGDEIPEELYQVVAEVLAFVYRVTDNTSK